MHLKARPPIFLPCEFQAEIEKLSKAALMDLAWDYATRCTEGEGVEDIMAELRKSAEIVTLHRKRSITT
jgi:hypothetical protein